MAEHAPATDAGTPAPQPKRRKAVPRKKAAADPPARPAPASDSKSKSKTDIAIEQAAARLAADAPPLTEWQKRRIAELFAPAVSAVVKH